MADISKIKLPDNNTYNIKDYRIPGVDSTPTSGSSNLVTSGGVYNAVDGIEQFYFVQGSSSAAGNSTSGSYLSVKWEGTIQGVSAAYDGLKIAYRIATRTGVATAGVVLSIDGTNYYPVVIQNNTLVTTHYPVGSTVLMVFNSTQTASAYLTSNTKTTVTGCWQIMEYDSNTNTYQREYVSSDNVEYPITTRYNTTTGESYYEEYGRYSEGVTLNPSTNTITASKFKVTSGTSSQFLKADGSVDSNTYATTSQIPSVPVTDVTVGGSSVVSSGTAVIPAIPSAPGTLNTTATTSQTTNASESLSGSVTLHKVSKTGSYWDLTYKPWQQGGNNGESLYWGYECAVAGSRSLAEGYKCETGGSYTSNTKSASQSNMAGNCSHAEGNATIAKGLSCHSEGKKTFASGEGSHAEGINTEAKGKASHSEGEYTQTNNYGEHAEGRYNKSTQTSSTYGNAGNTTHSIGIGTGTSDRKNAVEVMENGDVYIKGIGSYDGTNYSDASSLQTVISNVPSASNFVQKSGDTMSANATLTFTDSTGDYTTIIAPRQTSINDSDNGYSILMTVNSAPILSIDDGSENSLYKTDSIVYDDGSNSYTLSYPSASGTLALTSDIPAGLPSVTSSDNGKVLTVVYGAWAAATASGGDESLTTSEIDTIWTTAMS